MQRGCNGGWHEDVHLHSSNGSYTGNDLQQNRNQLVSRQHIIFLLPRNQHFEKDDQLFLFRSLYEITYRVLRTAKKNARRLIFRQLMIFRRQTFLTYQCNFQNCNIFPRDEEI